MVFSGLNWLSIGSSDWLVWTFYFHKRPGIYWPIKLLSASQKALYSI